MLSPKIPQPPLFKVYIRKLIPGATSISVKIRAMDIKQAKRGARMMLRNRFRMELGRDYEIVTIKEIKE